MSLFMRKPDLVRHKPCCTETDYKARGLKFWIYEVEQKAKTKVLISCTVLLIYAFGFSYVKSRLSNDKAQMEINSM